jgi:hypothetical protein
MLSTPVVGVDNKNDMAEALLAPCLWSDIVTGITLQEHKGSGIPNKEALITGQRPEPPRCFSTSRGDISTLSRPAIKKPNNKYGDISRAVNQKLTAIDLKIASIF